MITLTDRQNRPVARTTVRVSGPDFGSLHELVSGLAAFAAEVQWTSRGQLIISGVPAALIGDLAFDMGVRLHELCTDVRADHALVS